MMGMEGRVPSRPPQESATTRLRKSTGWQAERGSPLFQDSTIPSFLSLSLFNGGGLIILRGT